MSNFLSDGRSNYPNWPNKSAKPAISVSSEGAFAECPRKWFNEYCSDLLPVEQGKRIRAEKPLLSAPMLTGKVAHDIIEKSIRHYKETGEAPEDHLNDIREVCRKRLREYHVFSHQWAKAVSTGRPLPQGSDLAPMEPIFRGAVLTAEEGTHLLNTVEGYIRNFLRSPVYGLLMAQSNPDQIVLQPTEPLSDGWARAIPWYWIDDNPVYASYDLIILSHCDEGELRASVVDWKTGSREKGESRVENQLNYYAPFVAHEFGLPYDRIELIAAWIGDCAEISAFEPMPSFAESRSEQWSHWRQDLRMRQADVKSDRSLLDVRFPMHSDHFRCRYCKYRSCPGFTRHLSGAANLGADAAKPSENSDDEAY